MFRVTIKKIFVIVSIIFLISINLTQIYNLEDGNEKFIQSSNTNPIEPDNTQELSITPSDPGTRGARYLEDIIHLNDPVVQLTIISGDSQDNAYGNLGGGTPIATGDIDNDGIEDLLVSSPFADGKSETVYSAGQVMVIYGRNQTHPGTIFDQAEQNFDEINLVIHGGRSSSIMGFSLACGDIDGDNYDDIIMGGPYANGKNDRRTNSGEVYVIYGGPRHVLGEEIDLFATAPALTIYGASGGNWPNYDLSGYSLAVGDVLGDSKDDIIIGAIYANGPNRTNCGRVHVIKGNSRAILGSEIDLRGGGDVNIIGANSNDYAGNKVACGDINGDTKKDIIISAYGVDPSGARTNAGGAYVIYGAENLASTIDLNISADVTIYGAGYSDLFGYSLASGNINGDPFDDIVIGAVYGDGQNNAIGNGGEIYIIYGSATLAATLDTLQNDQDIVIYGKDSYDYFGFSLATGNVNNDKYDDVLIGTYLGDGEQNSKSNCGEAYLILGNSTSNLPSTIDPATGSKTIFYGIDNDDYTGRYVQCGDIDNDNFEDVIIFAPYGDGPSNGRDYAGEYYVIYGAPPPVKNEFLEIIGTEDEENTVFSKYKNYIFRINVSNILGYKDFKSVSLIIDPDDHNIEFRWLRLGNEFIEVHDPLELAECESTITNVKHDNNYNYSIDFHLNFDWGFGKNIPIDCKVSTVGEKSLRDVDVYYGIFQVNNKVNFKGDLKVNGASQGELKENDWVKGGEELTFSGLTVVYDGTEDKYPPSAEYSLGIQDSSDLTPIDKPNEGEALIGVINAPEQTVNYNYQVKIIGLPEGSDVSDKIITLNIDNDPPGIPKEIICKADIFDELEAAPADNDPEIYLTWQKVTDQGSGTNKYYFSFENNSETNNGEWSADNKAKLANASEGLRDVYVWAEDNVGNIGTAGKSQIFIDLTEITFDSFQPLSDDWFNSKLINCTIQVQDIGGFGVDIDRVEYWDIQTKFWRPVTAVIHYDDFTSVDALAEAEFNEGISSYIKFRAWDIVGNGPTESEKYSFKIDTTPVTYKEVFPDPEIKQSTTEIKCYITVEDLAGAGVNLSTIQYSYSTNGLGNFTAWTDSELATIAKQPDPEESSRWFVDINFERGSENYIRWRAKDLAGNGYTVSENYSVLVNALPTIIVKDIDTNKKYDTKSDIILNAEGSYDIDDEKQSLQFFWRSNISGNLGDEPNLNVNLREGPHRITLEVFDGLNSAYFETNLTIAPYKKPSSGGGISSISEGVDSFVLALIIIIIIIIILFMVVLTRERRKRRYLEEKVISSGFSFPARYQPMVPISKLTPKLRAEATMAGAEPFPVSASPYTVACKSAAEQLPRVGETTGAFAATRPTVGGVSAGTIPTTYTGPIVSTPGQQLPQLPPAQPTIIPQPTVKKPQEEVGSATTEDYNIKMPTPTVSIPGQGPPQTQPQPSPTPTIKQEEPDQDLPLGLTPDDPEYLRRIRKNDED